MKTRKLVMKSTLLLAAGLLLFVSCENDEVAFDAVGDVYVLKKMIGNETVYAPTYYLYGNKSVASVTVTPPEGSAGINLEAFANSSFTFYKGIEESDYSATKPSEGNYTFDVVDADGASFQTTDSFGDEEIDLPTITEVTYDDANSYIYLSWDLVTDANAYNVKLYNENGDLVYNGSALTDDSDEFTISDNDGHWMETPISNTVYQVELNAFMFDSEATENDWNTNFQFITLTDTLVTWNPI